jgi:hypothetical protein
MSIATETPDLQALEPDPLQTTPDEVERYLALVQGAAESQPGMAKRLAWNQIRLAGVRARAHRSEAHESLNRMFRLGVPPDPPIDGPTKGILVTPVMPRLAEIPFRGLSEAWMPWMGKRFDPSTQSGDNLLRPSARMPSRILWPSYRPADAGDGQLAAFKFRTYASPGTLDTDRQTMKIDYDSEENPGFLIRDILDELVQIVPGAYLGKVLVRRKRGASWRLLGYFALHT